MALSFILEVDELLAEVLLSQTTLNLVDGLQPIKTSRKWTCRGCAPLDMLRFAFGLVLIVVSYFLFLKPYHEALSAPAIALCGGQLDFTFRGGTAESPQIV